MASNYKVQNVDLDNIFHPIGAGAPGPNTGYTVGSQDLAARYQAKQTGGDIGYNTGYAVGAQDLRELFNKYSY